LLVLEELCANSQPLGVAVVGDSFGTPTQKNLNQKKKKKKRNN
jgi:hypothetical protein